MQYAQRAGIEGTISQGVRRCGIRRARYRGLAKTQLQHLATASAINLLRQPQSQQSGSSPLLILLAKSASRPKHADKGCNPCFRMGCSRQPRSEPHQIECCTHKDVLLVRFRKSDIPRAPHTTAAHGLGDCAFNPSPFHGFALVLRRFLSAAGGLKGFMRRLRAECQGSSYPFHRLYAHLAMETGRTIA